MMPDPRRFDDRYDPDQYPRDVPDRSEYMDPPDEVEPDDNVPDAVADPPPAPAPVRYLDHDGTYRDFICGVCAGPVTSLTDPEGWTRWSCPCGRTCGMSAPYGALDLGIIRQEPDGENNFAVFKETWEGVQTVRHDKVTDLIRTDVPDSEP